jgi:exodeoxyribonuclease V alpha subunit
MSDRYPALGMQTAWRRFELETGVEAQSPFERRLREIESGSEVLNLKRDAVHLAVEIAALEPYLDDEQRLALIALVVVSLAALQEGSTRFPVTGESAREPMQRMLGPLCADASAAITCSISIDRLLSSGAAAGVIGRDPKQPAPLLYLPPYVYHQRIRAAETALAARLAALIAGEKPTVDEERLQRALSEVASIPGAADGNAFKLSDEQRDAAAAALGSRLTVISGGPGTGKTSIVLAILRLMVRLGSGPETVALAAPTGKAAYRMGECIREGLSHLKGGDHDDERLIAAGLAPSTIHRLLDYSPGLARFRRHRNNPLPHSTIIIDEGSMLDLTLMERLLDAIAIAAPTRLIVLGDADQLPSVAAGAVFRDLILATTASPPIRSDRLSCACVRLRHSYRLNTAEASGRTISSLASAINEGVAEMTQAGEDGRPIVAQRRSVAELGFTGAEYLPQGPSGAFLDRWYAERVRGDREIRALVQRDYAGSASGFAFDGDERDRLGRLFAHLAGSRILCVTRVFDRGADRINDRLHRRAAEEAGLLADRNRFIAGEPLMMTRNDYERMLFNGDQGIAVRVRLPAGAPHLMAVFPRGNNFVAFALDALQSELELCYAMTVHKAQGSEFDAVALILPDADIPILTREILYTAISRARNSALIVGDEKILRLASSRKVERCSGLSEQLAALTA